MSNELLAITFMLCSLVCYLLRWLPIFGFLWKLFATFYMVMIGFFVAGFVKKKVKDNWFN
jgi:hypothetical protein